MHVYIEDLGAKRGLNYAIALIFSNIHKTNLITPEKYHCIHSNPEQKQQYNTNQIVRSENC